MAFPRRHWTANIMTKKHIFFAFLGITVILTFTSVMLANHDTARYGFRSLSRQLKASLYRVYHRDWGNEKEIAKMKKAFSQRRTLRETLQIFKTGIQPMDMRFSSDIKNITRLNQTRAMTKKRTCAIVGNSGVLRDSMCGTVIDSSDFVIRMNLALFGGKFAPDVGSKVGLMTLNSEQYRHLMDCTDFYGNTTYDELPLVCRELLSSLSRLNGSTLWYFGSVAHNNDLKTVLAALHDFFDLHFGFAYSPAEMKSQVKKVLKLRSPSTGMAMYAAATHFCSRIQLFGFFPFYKDPTNRTLFYHYFDAMEKNYTTNIHEMPDEFKVFLRLEEKGALRIVNDCSGKWNNDILRKRFKLYKHLKGDELGDFDMYVQGQAEIQPG